MPLSRLINVKGDLFATAFTFGLQALIRLVSSLVLTRVLVPEDYGTISILLSILYVVGNIVDTNVTIFIVRDPNAEQPRYINTAWTIRLSRSILSCAVLFAVAPLIATGIYHLPSLTLPLRVFSFWFLIDGFESMAFALAVRRKKARLQMYCELGSNIVATAFSIAYCYRYHTFWGIAFSMLLNRLILTVLSHLFYRELRPRFALDLTAAREILSFSKFTIPSSFLTLALNQFDKTIFLRLFDLGLLGIYGLAGNIAGSIEGVISKVSQSVLYPRIAHNFREHPDTATTRYYTENVKLFAGIIAMPAAVCGAAHFLITLLYNSRYAAAGSVLQALALRTLLISFASPAEDLLISTGRYHVILIGNILKAASIVTGSLLGYYFFGFLGFVYGIALSTLGPLAYYLWLQKKNGLLIARYELYKVAFALAIVALSYLGSTLFLTLLPGFTLKR